MTEKVFVPVHVVYLGPRLTSDKKTYHVYAPLSIVEKFDHESEVLDGKSSWYSFKKKPEHIIGCVYEMECVLDEKEVISSCRFSTAKFVQRGGFKSEIHWRAFEKTVNHAKNEASLKRKMDQDNPLKRNIDALRAAYLRQPPNMRKAFLITIMKEISE